jgi:hypothetical protein
MNMCRFLKVFRDKSPDLTSLDFFFLWCWMKSDVHKRRLDTRDELFARNLDVAAGIKKREDQLRRTADYLRTRVAKCTEVDGGTFKNLL